VVSRRHIIVAGLVLPLVQGRALAQTPACGKQTARQTAGPFFKPDSPKRISLLEKDSKGDKLVVTGLVLSAACRPVANALLDFWHADELGEYDNRSQLYFPKGFGHHNDGLYRPELEMKMATRDAGRFDFVVDA